MDTVERFEQYLQHLSDGLGIRTVTPASEDTVPD